MTKFISGHIKSQLILPVTQHMSLHIHGGCRIGNHVTYFLQIEVLLSDIIFYSLYAFGTSKRTSTAKIIISLYWFNYSLDRTLIQLVSVATFDISRSFRNVICFRLYILHHSSNKFCKLLCHAVCGFLHFLVV